MDVFAPCSYHPSVTSRCLRCAACFLCFCADGVSNVAAQLSERWQEGAGRSLACALFGAAAQEEPAVPWRSERGCSVSSHAALRSESLFWVLCWCPCPVNECEGGARRRGCLKCCWLAKRKNIYSALLKCLGSGSETAERCLGSAAHNAKGGVRCPPGTPGGSAVGLELWKHRA